jgi:hypothetical protein
MVLGYIPTPLASAPSTEFGYRRCVASNISQSSPVFKYGQLLPSRPRCRCINMNHPPSAYRPILSFLPPAPFRLPWNSTLPTLKHENRLLYPVHLIMVGFFFGCVLHADTYPFAPSFIVLPCFLHQVLPGSHMSSFSVFCM